MGVVDHRVFTENRLKVYAVPNRGEYFIHDEQYRYCFIRNLSVFSLSLLSLNGNSQQDIISHIENANYKPHRFILNVPEED